MRAAAAELAIPEGRPLTVTGGLTFGSGPLNSYMLHAFAVYSCEPPAHGFRCENLQEQVDAFPLREAVVDWEGPVTVEAYTVAYRAGEPRIGHAACLTDDGRRTWETVEDYAVPEAMTREEFCGRRGRPDGRGRLSVDQEKEGGSRSSGSDPVYSDIRRMMHSSVLRRLI